MQLKRPLDESSRELRATQRRRGEPEEEEDGDAEETPMEIVLRWCKCAFDASTPDIFDPLYHPLQAAVACGTVKDVAAILEHGRKCALRIEDPDKLYGFGPRLLEGADFETVDFKRRCRSPVACAAHKGDLAMVQYLVSMGACVDGSYAETRIRSSCMKPALHFAVGRQNAEMVRFLLDSGADVECVDTHGDTALMHAVEHGLEDMVGLLLDRCARVEASDAYGRTVLFSAVLEGRLDLVTMLLDRGANVHAEDENGATALFDAVGFNGSKVMVNELLRRGARIEQRDTENGRTPLIQAACLGSLDTVQALLVAGADTSAKDHRGQTALMRASMRGMFAIVDVLLRTPGAASMMELKDNDGNTALGNAVLCPENLFWYEEDGSCAVFFRSAHRESDVEDEEDAKSCRKDIRRVIRLLLSKGAALDERLHAHLRRKDADSYKRFFSS